MKEKLMNINVISMNEIRIKNIFEIIDNRYVFTREDAIEICEHHLGVLRDAEVFEVANYYIPAAIEFFEGLRNTMLLNI